MSKQIDILAFFDDDRLPQSRQRYEEENGEKPYGLIVDNVTVWDLIAKTELLVGGDLAEELFNDGWAEREIWGFRILAVVTTAKRADLVDEATFKEVLKAATKNDGD